MTISLLLEMAESAHPDRVAVVSDGRSVTVSELAALTGGAAAAIAKQGAHQVAYVGTGGLSLPVLLFGSARAGVPFTPLNYRLSSDSLDALLKRLTTPLVVTDREYLGAVESIGSDVTVMETDEFLNQAMGCAPIDTQPDPEHTAVVLFTSGTTSQPKAVQLTHANLTSYVMQTVEFDTCTAVDAALVCVPPYHIAGVSAVLSNIYGGRKMVYLRRFDPDAWIRLVRDERVSTATVVPTMLDRIVTALESHPAELPSLTNLAYGGSKVGLPLVRKALRLLPEVGFVNAYGLTETSSTIAILTPDDHRMAYSSADEVVSRRLGSVGRPVPGIEVEIRDDQGVPLGASQTGELYVRGEQVSGTYADIGSVLDADGWFPTKDIATVDADGYLYIGGRSDDTIIRGGENIAPAELEDVLIEHPDVREVAVVGVEDRSWGQIIVAVVVPQLNRSPDPDELKSFVRAALRGSRTPDRVVLRDELPWSDTGKVLRRTLVAQLQQDAASQQDSIDGNRVTTGESR